MGRKRKQVDAEGINKSNLPPCRVCDAPGAGFHYGVNTCEACKGFFHRSLKIHPQYKCEGDSSCVIEHGHSKLCQQCRYQKCLSVGMAKEAIKTGRYTSAKRTSDILEIKRLQQTKKFVECEHPVGRLDQVLVNQLAIGNDSGSENSLDCDGQSSQCSLIYGNAHGHISSGSIVKFHPSLSNCLILSGSQTSVVTGKQESHVNHIDQVQVEAGNHGPKICDTVGKIEATEIDHNIQPFLSESPKECNQVQACCSQEFVPLSVEASPLSQMPSSYGSPLEGSTMKLSPSMLTDAASTMLSLSSSSQYTSSPPSTSSKALASLYSPSSSASVNSPEVSLLSPFSLVSSPASSVRSGTLSSSVPNQRVESYISDLPDSDTDNCETNCKDSYEVDGKNRCGVDDKDICELYTDKDLVVRILLEADENYMGPLWDTMSDEEIKQQQQEHFESCKLEREIFGELHRLPDHEYDYIFATTGLDTDDRQKRLHLMGTSLEKTIRAMVKFCKTIPGFSRLDVNDKIKLIKYSRQEFCIFILYKFMDVEKKIMRGLDNQWRCENEMIRLITNSDAHAFRENLEQHFQFYHSLQKLKLSHEELSVVRALIVMAPDRDPYVMSSLARNIHWQLNECLIHVLSKRYPNPMLIYAKILDRLTEARSRTENMVCFFRRLKIDKYSDLKNNPLLREMCAGILFDCKDDGDDNDEDTDTNS